MDQNSKKNVEIEDEVIKMVQEKGKRRKLLLIIPLVVVVIALASAYFALKPPDIDYGSSQIHTQEELKEAMAVVIAAYKEMDNTLCSIAYSGDYKSQYELDYYNERGKTIYTGCIVFDVEFRTPFFGDIMWGPNERIRCRWTLVKEKDSDWVSFAIEH